MEWSKAGRQPSRGIIGKWAHLGRSWTILTLKGLCSILIWKWIGRCSEAPIHNNLRNRSILIIQPSPGSPSSAMARSQDLPQTQGSIQEELVDPSALPMWTPWWSTKFRLDSHLLRWLLPCWPWATTWEAQNWSTPNRSSTLSATKAPPRSATTPHHRWHLPQAARTHLWLLKRKRRTQEPHQNQLHQDSLTTSIKTQEASKTYHLWTQCLHKCSTAKWSHQSTWTKRNRNRGNRPSLASVELPTGKR